MSSAEGFEASLRLVLDMLSPLFADTRRELEDNILGNSTGALMASSLVLPCGATTSRKRHKEDYHHHI